MTGLDSLVSVFRSKVQGIPEIALCSVTLQENYLVINAPVKFVARALWDNRDELKKAASECGFIDSILIFCEGERYGPRISLSD